MAARAGGRVGGVNYAWSPTYAPIGPVPALSAFSGPIVSGSPFVIAGSNFESPQGDGAAQIVQGAITVALTESEWSDTEISISALDIFSTTLAFGAATVRVQNDTGNTGTRDVTLHPPANVAYFTLLAVNTTAAYRLTGTPDLQVGGQVAYGTFLYSDSACEEITGHYVITDDALDGSFVVDAAAPNGTYYFPAWRRRTDTGAWEYAVQTVVVAVVVVGSGASQEVGSDTASGFGGVSNVGSGASTESSGDTSTGSGTPIISGSGASAESGNDTSGGSLATITGSGASVESGGDVSAGTGAGAAQSPTNLPLAVGARYIAVRVAARGGRPVRQAKYIYEQIVGERLVYSVDWSDYIAQSGLAFDSFVASIADGDSVQVVATELSGSVASVLLYAVASGVSLVQIAASIGVETDVFTFEVDVFEAADE